MKIFGHCRFSYLGRTDTGKAIVSLDDARKKLWNPARMAARFNLFENIMLPSIINQTDKAFDFVITTSNEMPDVFHDRLNKAVSGQKNIRILRTSETNIRRALRPIMLEANNDRADNAVHFRIDDDDAVSADYIAKLRHASAGLKPKTMVTFPRGVLGFMNGENACHRAFEKHSIAIGLALIKGPNDLVTPFEIQHRAYGKKNPVYSDPTFPAYHYTRHTTNNTNGYDQVLHRSGGVVDIVLENSLKVHPEFKDGARTTDEAEAMIAQAFPYTTGDTLRDAIASTYDPEIV